MKEGLNTQKTVLVIVSHPDDEAIGCGGTIAYFSDIGYKVSLLVLSNGIDSRDEVADNDGVSRNTAMSKSAKILGISKIYCEDFPDNSMDSVPMLSIVKSIERVVEQEKPDIVLTHHYGDLNIDHKITHKAVVTACRPIPEHSVKEMYAFEVVSSTEWGLPSNSFAPNMYVDISQYLELKLKALNAYDMEMRPSPHSRSIEHCKALSVSRGHSVGLGAAEAFSVIRVLY